RRMVATPLPEGDLDADARGPRRQGLPRTGGRGAAAVVGPPTRAGRVVLPLLPGRGALGAQARQRPGLVRDGVGVAGQARARRAVGAAGTALSPVTRSGAAPRCRWAA